MSSLDAAKRLGAPVINCDRCRTATLVADPPDHGLWAVQRFDDNGDLTEDTGIYCSHECARAALDALALAPGTSAVIYDGTKVYEAREG